MAKTDAIELITAVATVPVEGSRTYPVVPIVKDGTVQMLITMPEDSDVGEAIQLGTSEGLQDVPDSDITMTGDQATGVVGWETLNLGMLATNPEYDEQWRALRVPLDGTRTYLSASSPSQASEQRARLVYDDAADTMTDTQTGEVYQADNAQGLFVSPLTGAPMLTNGMPLGWRPGS